MITELLETPFLARRNTAEDAWDTRFKDDELTCPDCYDGWKEDEITREWYRCGKCQGGSLYVQLCVRCRKPESGKDECKCSVTDFMEGEK